MLKSLLTSNSTDYNFINSQFISKKIGVMDIFHAGVGSNAIYYLYLQGINAMNQKTALFVVINTSKRMDAS